MTQKRFQFDDEIELEELGDLWLVSYADMVTLLMGFFVILFSMSNLDENKFREMGSAVAQTLNADETAAMKNRENLSIDERRMRAFQLLISALNLPDNLDEAVRQIEASASAMQGLQGAREALADAVASGTMVGPEGDGGVMIRGSKEPDTIVDIVLSGGMLFSPGSNNLTEEAKRTIGEISDTIRGQRGLVDVEIVGHSDGSVVSGRNLFQDNWAISAARAGIVASEFIRRGIDPDVIRASGMADRRPLFAEHNSDGTANSENMAKNRRVEIKLKVARDDGPPENSVK